MDVDVDLDGAVDFDAILVVDVYDAGGAHVQGAVYDHVNVDAVPSARETTGAR